MQKFCNVPDQSICSDKANGCDSTTVLKDWKVRMDRNWFEETEIETGGNEKCLSGGKLIRV